MISPLFLRGTYKSDLTRQNDLFAGLAGSKAIWNGFTDVDRQTVLNDEDGTLTGFKKTLSVNDDPFFGAPVQVAECLSNVGVTPAFACAGKDTKTVSPPTARTSPYVYVTTVIYPDCAANKNDNGACGSSTKNTPPMPGEPGGIDTNRREALVGRGGQWSQDCAGPFCFGVPLYRQLLTDGPGSGSGREWKLWTSDAYKCDKNADQDRCDFPFIRMTVSSTWQRNTLTANGGTYYFDTTRPETKQPNRNDRKIWGQRDDPALGSPDDETAVNVECSQRLTGPCYPRSVNVFQGGQTYDVFFVYPTDQLKQTYQVYVGSETGRKFDPKTDVQAILVRPEGLNFKIDHFDVPSGTNGQPIYNAYLIDSKTGSKSPTGDVLEVEVDFTKLPPKINNEAYSFDPNNAANKDATCRLYVL